MTIFLVDCLNTPRAGPLQRLLRCCGLRRRQVRLVHCRHGRRPPLSDRRAPTDSARTPCERKKKKRPGWPCSGQKEAGGRGEGARDGDAAGGDDPIGTAARSGGPAAPLNWRCRPPPITDPLPTLRRRSPADAAMRRARRRPTDRTKNRGFELSPQELFRAREASTPGAMLAGVGIGTRSNVPQVDVDEVAARPQLPRLSPACYGGFGRVCFVGRSAAGSCLAALPTPRRWGGRWIGMESPARFANRPLQRNDLHYQPICVLVSDRLRRAKQQQQQQQRQSQQQQQQQLTGFSVAGDRLDICRRLVALLNPTMKHELANT
uniref:Uncharacterized protein n=1 Tax=Macrostomum lignano TaxID=282301 RepID=A0A1I8FFA5_9PLAT